MDADFVMEIVEQPRSLLVFYAPQPHMWKDLGRIKGCWLRSLSMLYPFFETKTWFVLEIKCISIS